MNLIAKLDGITDFCSAIKAFHIVRVLGGQDIKHRYKRSTLGPFWITISMAVMISTMGLVFGNLFKTPLYDFLPYLTLGLIIWGLISSCISEGCDALILAEGIIKQLPVPLYTHVLRIVWRNIIIFLHNIVIYPLVLVAMGRPINLDALLAIPGIFILVFNMSWISMLLALVCARFRDMAQIISSIMQVFFYLTPVIWMPSLLTHRAGESLLNFNPFYHLVNVVRAPLLGEIPSQTSYIVTLSMLIIGFVISFLALGKYKYRVAYWV
ncbi:ABC transporter permease [Lonsdalea iberica]|uniref:ABC transporter permease n=1 Tax=Lonsdalea iberica TaxID=1082703 RepID=A0A1X3RY06_9GAMM|nr:ABC transporter permease [Lonsdalea iberica]OSN06946.1 ABC transporter permease [Lonsdalea iberica]